MSTLPCILFEDEHLLVVNKPAGLNTHAPAPFAGEGLYEYLRNREARWSSLAIIHRLDKETSGVMVFTKTAFANRALARQFETREVLKKYLFLTDRPLPEAKWQRANRLKRVGERYVRSDTAGERAETLFEAVAVEDAAIGRHGDTETRGRGETETSPRVSVSPFPRFPVSPRLRSCSAIWAMPRTGRTHQIRVHAAESGCAILGDTLYGGTPARRLCLHAAEIRFKHPEASQPVTFAAPVDFEADTRDQLRAALIDSAQTNAFRLVHGESDGWPGWHLDALEDFLLSQATRPLSPDQSKELARQLERLSLRGAAHKILERQVRKTCPAEVSPLPVKGEMPLRPFVIRENGILYELSFQEGYSIGLFLDQRDNRRRLLTGYVAPGFSLPPAAPKSPPLTAPEEDGVQGRLAATRPGNLLNAFAYTCGFSACGAKGGWRTTSLDLSKKYLEWGRRNFALNKINPAEHEFFCGDVFDWLRRWEKKQRKFELVILDPPTFSQSRESGVFRADKDYARLVRSALSVLSPGGILFCSTNAEAWPPQAFLNSVQGAVTSSRRRVSQQHYAPQPLDFPVSRAEPAYLKTVWLRVQ